MTPTEYAAAIRATHAELDWLGQIPHTLDDVARIARELAGRDRTEAAMARPRPTGDGGSGGGLHSDPTADAALRNAGADEMRDAGGALLAAATTIVAHTAAASALVHQATGKPYRPCRTLTEAATDLYALAGMVDAVALLDRHDAEAWDEHVTCGIITTAAWLVPAAQGIYDQARPAERQRVVQRARRVCETCLPFGREVTPERGNRCNRCTALVAQHGVQTTAAIARWFDDHRTLEPPPRLVAAARHEQAEARRAAKVRAS